MDSCKYYKGRSSIVPKIKCIFIWILSRLLYGSSYLELGKSVYAQIFFVFFFFLLKILWIEIKILLCIRLLQLKIKYEAEKLCVICPDRRLNEMKRWKNNTNLNKVTISDKFLWIPWLISVINNRNNIFFSQNIKRTWKRRM